jgi:hypothetical protein
LPSDHLGLPGDSLESFKRTAERALQLGADVRIPLSRASDAFLTKAPTTCLDFDPTLKVKWYLGWTADQIQEARD